MGKMFEFEDSDYFYFCLQNLICDDDCIAAKITECEGGTVGILPLSEQAANFVASINNCTRGVHTLAFRPKTKAVFDKDDCQSDILHTRY